MKWIASLTLVVAGCGGGGGSPAPATSVRGVVSVVGSAPLETVIVTTQSEDRIGIVGPLRITVASLAGAEVALTGREADGALPGTSASFEPSGYDVTSVNGVPAWLGVLEREGDALVLAGRERLRLTAVPGELNERVGRTIWVSGRAEGGVLRVVSWGDVRVP